MLFFTLDHVLGTQTKVRLLRALAPLESPVSGREAQRLARIKSVSGTGRALDDLTDVGILDRDEAGGTHLYRLNREHVLAEPLVDLFRAEEGQLASLRELLRMSLKAADLQAAVRSVVLFGSLVRGEMRPDSDLDLLVIVESEEVVAPVRDAVLDTDALLRKRLGVRASPYVVSLERAKARQRDGDPFMAAINAEGRTLIGDPLEGLVGGW